MIEIGAQSLVNVAIMDEALPIRGKNGAQDVIAEQTEQIVRSFLKRPAAAKDGIQVGLAGSNANSVT